MIVISLAAIVALTVICLAIEHAYMVQKKRARLARGRYKEGQAILAEMDLAHQREVGRIEGIGIGLDSARERILKGAAINLTRALKVISEMETRDEERKETEYAE